MEEMDTRPWEKFEIAERFKALRRKALLSQTRLAGILGICRQSVCEIEKLRVMPHYATWDRFCELERKHREARTGQFSFPNLQMKKSSAQKGD